MTEQDAFLAAIDARPDDRLTRLVYADWLEERGDERSTFIRVMEEMRLLAIWSDEFQRLRLDRNRLRKSVDPAWQERMGYAPVHRPMFDTIPRRPEHRWRLAEEFIDIWHGGLKPGDGYSEGEVAEAEQRLGIRLPQELRHWYRLAGKRRDIWSVQDHFGECLPAWDSRHPNMLIIRWENQGCTRWFIRRDDLRLPDPPVWGGDGERLIANSVSEFALFVAVFESQWRSICCEVPLVHPRGTAEMPARFRRTTLPTEYWFVGGVEVWEATNTFILYDTNDWGFGFCRSEAAYQQIVEDFGDGVFRNN